MKNLMIALLLSAGSVAHAGTMVSGGGVPETEFQHSRAAIQTILESEEILGTLKNKGAILSIEPVQQLRDAYVIRTSKCQLYVQFTRTCEVKRGQLPQCDYSASVIQDAANTCGQ